MIEVPFKIGNVVVDFLFWKPREFSSIQREYSMLDNAIEYSLGHIHLTAVELQFDSNIYIYLPLTLI